MNFNGELAQNSWNNVPTLGLEISIRQSVVAVNAASISCGLSI
jgi:hypothetical protein